jgi:glutathione S-transferase
MEYSCPFVQRAWTVLEEKSTLPPPLPFISLSASLISCLGIPYKYIEVNPYNKPQSLISLNPRGLVPTLQYDNKPLFESTVICEFLEEAYPDHKPHLLPSDPYERARTRIWTDFCTSRIIPAFHRFLQFQPMSDKDGLAEVRKEFVEKWREFATEMDKEGPFFGDKEPGLIDFVVAPWAVSRTG